MKKRSMLAAVSMLPLLACTNQQVYDAIQHNQQLECQKLPGTQYEECMKEVSEPYQAYKRERDELIREED